MIILMGMDKTSTDFSKGARVGIAGATSAATQAAKGTVIGPYFLHRADVVIVHWDGHEAGRDLVMNTGNLCALGAVR